MHSDPIESPVNPLPPVVWLLFFLVITPELVFQLGEARLVGGPTAIGWRVEAIQMFGFSGLAFDWMLANGRWPLEHAMRFVTYPFVHGAFTSTLFAGVIVLAMGKLVGEVMGQVAVLVLFVACAVGGALIFGLLTGQQWLIGGFPSAYGLIGGYTFLAWQQLAGTGPRQLMAFRLIGVLMALQLVFGMLFEVGYSWVGELGGFAIGFLLSPFLVRGGFARIMNSLRSR